jgi:hypothetical protein
LKQRSWLFCLLKPESCYAHTAAQTYPAKSKSSNI